MTGHPDSLSPTRYPVPMREFLNDWWRLGKLIAGVIALPLLLWLLLVWAGVLR
ncbi:hypothetical protein GCM10025871_35000 [Deinococcus metallilatus]|nr:hypothetical protein GCM10025871_35000 [Deinococcus metallilatus]